jgi:hypothetical protein
MKNKIYNYGIGLFRIIALVVMSAITFAGIADVQETSGATAGMSDTENLKGEIRWKKDLGLPPTDPSGSMPVNNICLPFSVELLESNGDVISSDTQLEPGQANDEYYRCKYKLSAPQNRQLTVRPVITDHFSKIAWFRGKPLAPAKSGIKLPKPITTPVGKVYKTADIPAETRVFDKPEKYVTVGVKGTWLSFELGTQADFSGRIQTFRKDGGVSISLGWDPVPVDWCREWQANCGKPAADAFCQSKGFEVAKSFEKAANLSETVTITEKKICDKTNSPVCDGFREIVCTKK